jgi:hypothetical protein
MAKIIPIQRATEASIAALVDELGEVDRRLTLAEPDRQRRDVLKHELLQRFTANSADEPVTARGSLYEVQLSPKRNERTITDKKKAWAALKKALSLDGLVAALDLPLSLVDRHVPKTEQKLFIREERSGYRTLDVVAIRKAA